MYLQMLQMLQVLCPDGLRPPLLRPQTKKKTQMKKKLRGKTTNEEKII